MTTQFPAPEHRDTKGNYTGPRDEQYLKVFICHGCQSCWRMNEKDEIVDTGPHYLGIELVTKEEANGKA